MLAKLLEVDAELFAAYQDECIQHSKRQTLCILEKSLEGRCCGQHTAEGEARVREWVLLIEDCFITWQVASDLGAHGSSRNSPEEQKGTIQKCDPR